MDTQNDFVYGPNINVIPGSPDSITTSADLLDEIEELIPDGRDTNAGMTDAGRREDVSAAAAPRRGFLRSGTVMARAAKNAVTVEPLLAVFQLSAVLSALATQNLNLRKACRVNLRLGDAACAALEGLHRHGNGTGNGNGTVSSWRPADAELAAQRLVAGMMVWQNAVQNAVPCALLVFVGSWSDRHHRARRPLMLVPVLGELVRNAGLFACVRFFQELPMEAAGLVESVPSSLAGGMPVLFLAVFAYVGDITTVENRTFRVGLVTLFSCISIPIGAALSGILFRDYGFYGVYSVSTALYVFCFVYVVLVIKDNNKPLNVEEICKDQPHKIIKQSFSHVIADFFDLKHIKEAFRVTFKQQNDSRRTDIILLLIVIVILIGPLSGEQSLMYLLTRVKFNWNEVDYSIFSTYYFICNLIGIGFMLCVMVNRFGIDDRLIGVIGCLSKALASFVYAFAPTEFVFYLAPLVDIFHGTAFVAMRSMLSKLVPASELGQVLAVFSLAETLIPAIFRPLYSALYQKTLHWLPGAFYIFGGFINIPGVFIFIFMYKKHKQQNETENKKMLS